MAYCVFRGFVEHVDPATGKWVRTELPPSVRAQDALEPNEIGPFGRDFERIFLTWVMTPVAKIPEGFLDPDLFDPDYCADFGSTNLANIQKIDWHGILDYQAMPLFHRDEIGRTVATACASDIEKLELIYGSVPDLQSSRLVSWVEWFSKL